MTENVTWHPGAVSRTQRHAVTGGPGMTIWLTGLSGSGKSTVAAKAEAELVLHGRAAYTLDGDNVRHGLNADLGFSAEDRVENVRRVGEVARLMADAGFVVLVPVISPYRADRNSVRQAHADAGIPFGEVHVATSIEECEKRDPKGLYARARAGEITGFTGIDDPYEEPLDPEAIVDAGTQTLAESVSTVLELVARLASA
ncbi:MAG: adenylyl-sulfate kinase [bacterium]|nr:adenylyl-sulfate kinase [bacterium]